MKSTLAAGIIVALAAISSSGQVATAPPTVTPRPATVAPATNDPAAVPPVRLPPAMTLAPEAFVGGNTNEIVSIPMGEPIGWSSDAVELRPSLRLAPDTNRVTETRSVLPRLIKPAPERRGFGGFLASFVNLINPLAPAEDGVAASTEHWYEGRINTAPVPRSMRDERYHEAKWEFFVVGLDGPRAPREKP